jgi:hypothetical protein
MPGSVPSNESISLVQSSSRVLPTVRTPKVAWFRAALAAGAMSRTIVG